MKRSVWVLTLALLLTGPLAWPAGNTRAETRLQVRQAQIRYLKLRLRNTKLLLAHDRKIASPTSPLIKTEREQIQLYARLIAADQKQSGKATKKGK